MTKKERRKLDKYYSKYGINYAMYEAQLKAQNGACALCLKKPKPGQRRMAVDHDHGSGITRSILCFYCNKYRVGRLTYEWAFKIAEYLYKYEQN